MTGCKYRGSALANPKRPQCRLLLRLWSFWACRSRSKSGIFDLPSKFSLGLATKLFSDTLLLKFCKCLSSNLLSGYYKSVKTTTAFFYPQITPFFCLDRLFSPGYPMKVNRKSIFLNGTKTQPSADRRSEQRNLITYNEQRK